MTIVIIIGLIILVILAANKQKNDQTGRLVTGRMFQMLESFKIVDSTVKLEIFTQRLEMLCNLAQSLPTNTNLTQLAESTLKTYARKYPNVYITPTYRLILQQPQTVCSSKFLDEAATAFYMRFCSKLKEGMSVLKTQVAKQRRITQAKECAEKVIIMLTSHDKQKYIDAINGACSDLSSSHTP